MRESFENILGGYNESAKDKMSENTPDEEEGIDFILNMRMKEAVRKRNSTYDAQEEIFEIQQEKQAIMKELREIISRLDDAERNPNESMVIQKDGVLLVLDEEGGSGSDATKGEILTDMEWGMGYYLDPATVDRNLRKRYHIELAKRKLMDKLDRQITIDETSSWNTSDALKSAYVGREKATGFENGFLAEKMVKNFLKKLSYDYDADFTVLEADAFQDVHKKMDFIIRRKKHVRGVGVEESDEIERVGVQFTVNTDAEVQERKAELIQQAKGYLKPTDMIDDIVLVTVSSQPVREAFDKWRKDPKPGGPDKLWSMDVKEGIFRAVMKGIMTEKEIDEQWSDVLMLSEAA